MNAREFAGLLIEEVNLLIAARHYHAVPIDAEGLYLPALIEVLAAKLLLITARLDEHEKVINYLGIS